MQGIAALIDLQGQDHYALHGRGGHGESSENYYHYDETGAFSFSLLMDTGGSDDFYSTDRSNNKTFTTGKFNEKQPAKSPLHGLFIDTSDAMRFKTPVGKPLTK